MASGIPTRRTTRRIDENAPPPAGTIATRARSAAANTGNNAANTAIPQMKRTASALGATTRSTTADNKPIPTGTSTSQVNKPGTRRRAALGEIGTAPNAAKGDKGKAAERRPLATRETSQPAVRRTTRSTTLEAREEKPTVAVKRKVGSVTSSTTNLRPRPGYSRHGSAVSAASTSTSTSTARPGRQLKETVSITEDGPAPKRPRPSTPEDVFTDNYDADNKVVAVAEPSSKAPVPKDYGWTDLDAEDEGDPTMVSEYVVDAFAYMMELEKSTMPDSKYMENQEELQWKMRQILNDWIVEVHTKFRLLPETLLIAINLIDRFLTARTVSLEKFQLVGLTALFVAAKYEEVICPSVTHFLHMADGGYDVDEILRAERYLLQTLDFDLAYPNPLHFLRRVSKADGYDVHSRTVAKFFIEISCIDHRLLPYPPSMLAAAAMWLARLCFDRGPWHANMVHYSTYAQHELLECAQVMLDYAVDPELDTSTAFFKKYASRKHLKASVFVREWAQHRWPDSAKGRSSNQGRELEAEFGGEQQAPLPPNSPSA
ncbi:uncharacterized protein CcaverHIS019_0507830 [Cutaneotrichosporon cavernicola]|uniref:A/B/D/E cyclin n=1 Tax=Cutaneotrichosporon cavernicola TaxID=279322 RepID=A0AA48L752_9TREE|nr:uncharacterized protein CcaverHIS019_0507830 [Cutaneotrichosporon cavernicola]BEI93155.1 hypothetical protein CcaverHIS019_0507830 [Cutaneotrichosporon cavernicola]BEJ00932.1 hypothetical protein CcaverHIS631_0507890 [Cutaneotrichosporon cavernicola]BEJ08697.1 hypothetical protein CcaverHIS641_0507910 [Cutaneotrichosporon cavernicola]